MRRVLLIILIIMAYSHIVNRMSAKKTDMQGKQMVHVESIFRIGLISICSKSDATS